MSNRTRTYAEIVNPWISISEAALMLGVCCATLRKWDRNGAFPATRTPGGQRKYRLRDVKSLMGEDQDELAPS